MNSAFCIHNATVIAGYARMDRSAVFVEGNSIADIFSERRFAQKAFGPEVELIDAQGAYLTPGFIDTHIHGIGGFGTEDLSADSILGMSRALPSWGVTSFAPTIYPMPEEDMIRAIRAVFGDAADGINVSSTKSATGHMLGAAGAVEAIISTLAIVHGAIPPTINLAQQDPECNLNCTPNVPRRRTVDAVLSNSSGFGGHNATLVVRRLTD